MTDEELRQRLEALRHEHRELDRTIELLRATENHDQLRVARLKKRKLALRDAIAKIETMLIPDIIA